MKVQGERTFAAPRSRVWEVVNDPASMAQLMPGVESFDVQDDRNWTANVKIPLGLGGLKMKVKMERAEERELEFARMLAKGSGVGAMMNMETSFNLSDTPEDGTAMRWEADVRIAGPVGSMGQRVLQPIVNQQVQNVLNALERQVESGGDKAAGSVSQGAGDTGDSVGPSTGLAGGTEPSTAATATTDPAVKDYGPPADGSPEAEPPAGTSGADEGLSPWAPESYEPDPQGPTTSTEDTR